MQSAAIDWEDVSVLVFTLGGILTFIGFWCFVCWMISVLGGWGRMAARFPRTLAPTGQRFDMQSGSVGLANYNNCLTIHVSGAGIDFAVWPIFRMGHKPVFIPWQELNHPRVKQFLWYKYVRIDVGSPKLATITVSEKVFSAFQNISGRPTA
ncbi:MAG: hypothetical protein H7A51_14450 [Akkermansiaceae bacterium]|nr:hypothetical protein [Akkermansiaceae bacterium]